jgi:hypothetical protein
MDLSDPAAPRLSQSTGELTLAFFQAPYKEAEPAAWTTP